MPETRDITPIRTKDIEAYPSEKVGLDPQKESTKALYFEIYEEYSISNLTEKQLALKHGYSAQHISEILKWVSSQLADTDSNTKVRSIIDRLKIRQQDFEDWLAKDLKPKEAVLVHAELRKTDRLIAELEGVLSTALIDMSDRRQVHMNMNSSMANRRRGADVKKNSATTTGPTEGVPAGQDTPAPVETEPVLEPDIPRQGQDKSTGG